MRGVVVAFLLLAGCKDKVKVTITVDPRATERQIVAWLAKDSVAATATCPSGIPMQDGQMFDCQAKDGESGQTFAVAIAVADDGTNITINPRGMLVDKSEMPAMIHDKTGLAGEVVLTCDRILFQLNETGTCKFTVGAQHGHIDLKLTPESEKQHQVSMMLYTDP